MKKYSKIIVLPKGVTEDSQGNLLFECNKENFLYNIIGDPYEFTFKAVQKLYLDGACKEFILVGGNVETIKDGKKFEFLGDTGKPISKTEVMKFTLMHKYNLPSENLIVVTSTSNTIGNAETIKRYFFEKNIHSTGDIGILGLFYHLPRSLKIFKESAQLSLIPICAESIVYEEEFEHIRDFYRGEGFDEIIGSIQGGDSQIKGMGDQEKGTYVPRFK